ncbi:hypothetical protein INT45_003502 [Circinella minor]|uniref:Uncharacterized protein n=1 Tax=Circinella minor TaxID=1195481 RepID=A0A8H7VP94_9FUNG|nr:hypothetical protein INT45_003502 [Circinella minor]
MSIPTTATTVISSSTVPGVKRVYEFPEWRFSPTSEVLLFNFKNNLDNEEEAISAIAERFGMDQIAGARRLCHKSFLTSSSLKPVTLYEHQQQQQWLVIEVLFATASVRREALRYGICFKNKQYMAWTTCNQYSSCTAFSICGMPIQKQEEATEFAKQRVELVLQQHQEALSSSTPDKSDNNNKNSSVLQIQHVWLETNSAGIYKGSGTIILDGYDPTLAEKRNGSLSRYTDAHTYPLMVMFVRHCRMYCSYCRTLNHHNTEDCVGEQQVDSDDDYIDEKENDKQPFSDYYSPDFPHSIENSNVDDNAVSTTSSSYTAAEEASYDVIGKLKLYVCLYEIYKVERIIAGIYFMQRVL